MRQRMLRTGLSGGALIPGLVLRLGGTSFAGIGGGPDGRLKLGSRPCIETTGGAAAAPGVGSGGGGSLAVMVAGKLIFGLDGTPLLVAIGVKFVLLLTPGITPPAGCTLLKCGGVPLFGEAMAPVFRPMRLLVSGGRPEIRLLLGIAEFTAGVLPFVVALLGVAVLLTPGFRVPAPGRKPIGRVLLIVDRCGFEFQQPQAATQVTTRPHPNANLAARAENQVCMGIPFPE